MEINRELEDRNVVLWTVFDRLLIKWKSDPYDKIKRNYFQVVAVSVLLYGCTTRTLTKSMKKKLYVNYAIIFRAILNIHWRVTSQNSYCTAF